MKQPIRVYIDGGSRGNPGPAGFGVYAEDADGNEVAGLYGFLGTATNNIAEYSALVAALRWATDRSLTQVKVFSDSQLMVRQLNGAYKVRNAGLRPLFLQARGLAEGIASFAIAHVPREQNQKADALANLAMDEENGNFPPPA